MLFSAAKRQNSSQEKPSAPTVAEAQDNALQLSEITKSIAEVASGTQCESYLSRTDAIGKMMKPITLAMRKKTMTALSTIVNIWVEQTNPLLVIAEMFRDMRDFEKRSQTMAAAAEEMMASINEIARSAEVVSEDAKSVKTDLAEGVGHVDEALSSMEGISSAFGELTEKVRTLDQASEQIASILKTIEKIASQTNLLALNATIEAARAGDAGKGFAVVASEVKGLSKQTSSATEDIRKRIAALQDGMSDMLASMTDGTTRVTNGKEVIKAVSQSINLVGERVDAVTEKMVDVSAAVKQQSTAVNEVTGNIGAIAEMSREVLKKCEKVTLGINSAGGFVRSGLQAITKVLDSDMIIVLTKADHATYKKFILDTLIGQGELTSDKVFSHADCRLGKWCAQASEEVRSLPSFSNLQAPHKAVHDFGKQALVCHEQDDPTAALEAAKKMDEISFDVIKGINALYDEISLMNKRKREALGQ